MAVQFGEEKGVGKEPQMSNCLVFALGEDYVVALDGKKLVAARPCVGRKSCCGYAATLGKGEE